MSVLEGVGAWTKSVMIFTTLGGGFSLKPQVRDCLVFASSSLQNAADGKEPLP